MTAIHYCPHCNRPFDYDASDYHRKIKCGHNTCNRTFGFYYFDVSERREREVRKEAKQQQEQAARKRAQRLRRANRFNQRKPTAALVDEKEKHSQQEKLFVKGLIDVCPRCGMHRSEMDNVTRRDSKGNVIGPARYHLMKCNDEKKMQQYKLKLKRQEEMKKQQLSKETAQEDAMILNTWKNNGRQVGQLWMLNVRLLKSQCEIFNLPTGGTKNDLITKLAKHLRSSKPLLLTNSTAQEVTVGEDSGFDTSGIGRVDDEDLPSNLNMMETEELMGVCASYGIKFNPAKDRKVDLIAKLEKARYKGNKEMTLMLEGKKRDGSLLLKDGNTDTDHSGRKRKVRDEDEEFVIEIGGGSSSGGGSNSSNNNNNPISKKMGKKENPIVLGDVDID